MRRLLEKVTVNRKACLIFAIALVLSAPVSARQAPRLAYVAGGWLWTRPITASGTFVRGTRPIRVCRIWKSVNGESTAIMWAQNGRSLVLSHQADEQYGIWLVSNHAGAHPVKLAAGLDPTVSPDGRTVAFTRPPTARPIDWEMSDVVLLDLATRRTRVFRHNACEPLWSADGRLIVLLDGTNWPKDGYRIVVAEVKSSKEIWSRGSSILYSEPRLSPDGYNVAVSNMLSRPKAADEIIDRRTGLDIASRYPEPIGFIAPVLIRWSRDGHWLLWLWRAPDPENDGSWLWQALGLTDRTGRISRNLGPVTWSDSGMTADFAPDGRHLLWIRPATRTRTGSGSLIWSPIPGQPRRTLLRNVSAFAIEH